ncbi:transposase [Tsukamurella pseudospumae]|uniref:Transposase n=1 Tax=Tsukamurella pseudospumae TaxID=239498 RepID=A0A137ZML5_9ACTN|nr:transposase [Tsukamurella pseudospumae]KXO99429.1 transposase [Tsukamurella pseudospumae]KXP08834.1 transposase [Tsukamurella pseudospumae]KXP13885.1 transposase [Tsukamurella pseudospumae]
MPAAHPEEFRRRAVNLTREDGASVAQIAKDLGISESCLRRWMSIDDVDAGRKEGLSTTERAELAQLRRDKKRLEQEVEILKRASAYFARENILPK